jgi:D-apiose dehydrogenase
MILEGDAATLRISGEGKLFKATKGGIEQELPFVPATHGYKGDSVFATQQHLIHSLANGEPAESEARDYLQTVALVDAAYELSPQPKTI